MPDPEIEAMSSIADALSVLDDEAARSRVLRWAAEKYGVTALPLPNRDKPTVHQTWTSDVVQEDEDEDELVGRAKSAANSAAASTEGFHHFAELFDAVQPKTDLEKAITAAYWEQVIRGRSEWQSQTINKELRDLGHYVTSINKALASGMQRKPALVLQLRKTGAAQQGRKTYKLSTEGLKFIRGRIGQSS